MPAQTYIGFSSVGRHAPKTTITDIELIKQDLLNHFNTRIGERVGRPDFGSIIWDLMFSVGDDRTEALVIQDANRIVDSDPRVELLDAKVSIDESGHSIKLELQIRAIEIDVTEWFVTTFQ